MSNSRITRFEVNGESYSIELEPRRLLADVLRVDLMLTGTHLGCEHGVCGACTVLLDGSPVRSCLVLGVQVDGCSVQTVETLAGEFDPLNQLQSSFQRHHALQCGFCTSGMLMSLCAFLKERPSPTEAEVREVLAGHICRCTGYQQIVDAVMDVREVSQ